MASGWDETCDIRGSFPGLGRLFQPELRSWSLTPGSWEECPWKARQSVHWVPAGGERFYLFAWTGDSVVRGIAVNFVYSLHIPLRSQGNLQNSRVSPPDLSY